VIALLLPPLCLALLFLINLVFPHGDRVAAGAVGGPALIAALVVTGFCGLLFVALELVALYCGIAARGTGTGKAGLVVSGCLLLAIICLVIKAVA
jgi:hypothetical protein